MLMSVCQGTAVDAVETPSARGGVEFSGDTRATKSLRASAVLPLRELHDNKTLFLYGWTMF
jgi:hypothetical protein